MASLNPHTLTRSTKSCQWLDNITAKKFLKSPELMAITFSHLQITCMKYEERRCLLNAALTCKDFLDIGLDALWEELDSLVPLLKLLPDLQIDGRLGVTVYVCANFYVFIYYDLILSLVPW